MQLDMATKSRFERNWHNTLHFVHWCRYGETPQEARMRQVNKPTHTHASTQTINPVNRIPLEKILEPSITAFSRAPTRFTGLSIFKTVVPVIAITVSFFSLF